ncbi:MAG: hypothetical protein K2P79_08345 [Sphingomonas sp.]|nr:hypothetical protein [Sphingomonas sp.]
MNARQYLGAGAALAVLAAQPTTVAFAADAPPLKISAPQAVKGTETVVIGAFNVGFIFQSVDQTAATGGMIGAFGGTTRAKSELQGVTPEMMQAITDAAYADFRAQLEAKGFTVADPAAMFASPSFARVKPAPAPYEAGVLLDKKSKGKASYYKPAAIPGLVMMPGDVTPSGLSGMGMAMASGMTAYGMSDYAKANRHGVLSVVYLIDFSNAKRPGAFSFGGITVTSGMSVVNDYSRMSIVGPGGKTATITLKQPVAVEGDFAQMNDATRDAGLQKAANIMGGLAAVGGLGGMRFGKSKTFTFTARPGIYEQGAIKAASLANTRLADQLAALK